MPPLRGFSIIISPLRGWSVSQPYFSIIILQFQGNNLGFKYSEMPRRGNMIIVDYLDNIYPSPEGVIL
jgi:hypothetical protein